MLLGLTMLLGLVNENGRQPPSAVALVEAAVGRFEPLREVLIELCGARAAPVLDGLPTYARALAGVDIEVVATARSGNLSALHEALRGDYQVLIAELGSLVARKVLAPSVIARAQSLLGYDETIQSTRVAVFVARSALEHHRGQDAAHGRHPRQRRTERRSPRARDDRAQRGPRPRPPSNCGCARATSSSEYEELRRMIRYLRWYEGDYDQLAPSPFAARRYRPSSEGEISEERTDEDAEREASKPVTPSDGEPFTS